jgi:DNA-binding transcriptional MerR regulator
MKHSDEIEKTHFTIGEVSKLLNVAPSVIRFWEKEFSQLKPQKSKGGTRNFSQKDLQLLQRIYHLLKVEGFTLQGARERLKAGNAMADIDEIKEKLNKLRGFLVDLKKQLPD